MGLVNIHIEVPGDQLNVDREKVVRLCDKFFARCDKLEANPFEVGVAIGLMQEHMLQEYGCLPITSMVAEYVKEIELTTEETKEA